MVPPTLTTGVSSAAVWPSAGVTCAQIEGAWATMAPSDTASKPRHARIRKEEAFLPLPWSQPGKNVGSLAANGDELVVIGWLDREKSFRSSRALAAITSQSI